MDEDEILMLAAVGIVGFLLFTLLYPSDTASATGTFSPDAPDTVDRILSDIMPQGISASGLAFIKNQEGFSPFVYQDGAKQAIGYGHDIQPSDSIGTPLSTADASALLQLDLSPVESTIAANVKVPLTQGQYDALCSFIYNVGIGAFESSTLLKKLNASDYAGAAAQFAAWVNSAGKVNATLVARRNAETGIFTSTGTTGTIVGSV